jgi:hypothetical protein
MSISKTITSEMCLTGPMSDVSLRYGDSPLHRIWFDITDADVDILAKTYHDRIFRARRKAATDQFHWYHLLLQFDGNVFLIAYGDGREWAEILAPTEEQAVAVHREITAKLEALRPPTAPFFYMLRYEDEFYAERVEQVLDDPGAEFLQLCYGGDIELWLEQFSQRTGARPGGLTILEGPPGTGKTSLVSIMMRRLVKTHVFYVLQASQDNALSAPELVPFWKKQNKRHPDRIKILVIEDAERLLWPRGTGNREAVSAVLNIADGLVGRMLRLHIMCSVNARLDDLDPAITRPGRLMNQRTFARLPRHTARRLADLRELPFQHEENRHEFALAEVLNPNTKSLPTKPHIGFGK